ncbi:hypothetical protein [Streptomyces bungoensis]|uniref:hypothetical protein n=1 Tax=Streptomyces bungoensis TaxID=285568 RepID=UPI0034230386
MTTLPPDAATSGPLKDFATVWGSAATADDVAPTLACPEADTLAAVFHAAGAPDTARMGLGKHTATASKCHGHDTHPAPTTTPDLSLYDEHGNYVGAPGTEYPFSISDIAHATARLLGPDWTSAAGDWGVTGSDEAPSPHRTLYTLTIDYQGDLCITYQARPRAIIGSSPTAPCDHAAAPGPDGAEPTHSAARTTS